MAQKVPSRKTLKYAKNMQFVGNLVPGPGCRDPGTRPRRLGVRLKEIIKIRKMIKPPTGSRGEGSKQTHMEQPTHKIKYAEARGKSHLNKS